MCEPASRGPGPIAARTATFVVIANIVGAGVFTSLAFASVITFLGFVLSASAFLTVIGLFVFRWRWPAAPRPYRTWGYPVTPALFLIVTGWMLVFLLRFRPVESPAGLGAVALGIPVYLWAARTAAPAPRLGERAAMNRRSETAETWPMGDKT